MDKNKNIALIDRSKTKPQNYQLAVALNEARQKYKDLGMQYNELVAEHNATVDRLLGILQFMQLQCGVLYTAITDDPMIEDPLARIPGESLLEGGKADLAFLRNGWITFLQTLEETHDATKAQEAYENYIHNGGIK